VKRAEDDEPAARPPVVAGPDRGIGRLLTAAAPEREDSDPTAAEALLLHDDERTLVALRDAVLAEGLTPFCLDSVFDLIGPGGVAGSLRLAILGVTALEERDLEVVAVLRRAWPDATILVLFPPSHRERAARALAFGADASLLEPFYGAELSAFVKRTLARSERTREAAMPAEPRPAVPEAPSPSAPVPAIVPEDAGEVLVRLAAGMANAIRDPLEAIDDRLDAAEDGGVVDVVGLRADLVRIAGVVQGLLHFAVPHGLDLRPVDLANLVTGVFASRDVGAAGAEIAVRLSEARVEILAAPEALRTGLEMLRNRAVRVTPPEGKIKVKTRKRFEEGRRSVEITVDDGGAPLTEEQCARIFDPFPDQKSVDDGTGLELATLAGIVRDHGGTVSARAADATGTSIVVRLPMHDAKTPSASA
jgi:signal transduction histidine kinase